MKPIRQCCVITAVIAGLCCMTCGTTVQTERRDEKAEPAAAAQLPGKSERAAPAPADRSPAGKARHEREEGRVAEDTSIAPVPSKKKTDDRPGVIESERRVDAQAGSGLKAGFADDNRQFNYFVDFLEKYKGRARHIPIDIRERIILKVVDKGNLPLANAEVAIYDANRLLFQGKAYSDGSFPFYPSHLGKNQSSYRAAVSYAGRTRDLAVTRTGRRETRVVWDAPRPRINEVPLDIVFVMDTTGSMGEEIERLKRTIELIHLNLTSMPLRTRVRFGMVLYKDRRDEYLTRVIPLTDSLERFREQLADVEASGGGDHPEDLQAALEKTMKRIEWSANGVRMAFIITDAPPHLDYGQEYTYVNAVMDARKKGVKLFSVGTGGLNLDGEYVLRQISQYTLGKYIFLTYGERGESEGGVEGSVSHHSGANFQTDKLESIIIRFARDEVNNILGRKEAAGEEHFKAVRISTEQKEETLRKLFGMAANQLSDYSSIKLYPGTPTSVLPIVPSGPGLALSAEYFSEQLVLSASKNGFFRLVERRGLQQILRELELSMSGLVNDENAAKVGKLAGAKLLVTGKLYRRDDDYELFLRLLRVETAEVLSVTKARIDAKLGLNAESERKKGR